MSLRITATLLLVLAAGLAAGCGGDEGDEGAPIPAVAAQQLDGRLGEIQRRFDFGGGACADIANDSEPAVRQILASLPSDVDPDVRDALERSFDRLFELTAEQCDEQGGQEPDPEPAPLPETDTETVPTETLPEETEEEPPPEEEKEDKDKDKDDGEPPPGQGGEPPGQGGIIPGQGGGGGAIGPGELDG